MPPLASTPESFRDMVRRMTAQIFGMPDPVPDETEFPDPADPLPGIQPLPLARPDDGCGPYWQIMPFRPHEWPKGDYMIPLSEIVGSTKGNANEPMIDMAPGVMAKPDLTDLHSSISERLADDSHSREPALTESSPTDPQDTIPSPASTSSVRTGMEATFSPSVDADSFVLDSDWSASAPSSPLAVGSDATASAAAASDSEPLASPDSGETARSPHHIENLLESLDRQLTEASEGQTRMLDRLTELLRRALASQGDVARLAERLEQLETAHYVRGRM